LIINALKDTNKTTVKLCVTLLSIFELSKTCSTFLYFGKRRL